MKHDFEKQDFLSRISDLEHNYKEQSEKYRKLNADKTTNEQKLLAQLNDLQAQHSLAHSNVEQDYTEKLRKATEKHKQLQSDYEKLKQTLDNERDEANNQLNQTEKELKSKLDHANNEILQLRSEISTLKSESSTHRQENT